MADIKTNQSKVFNALKSMGYSGIGNNEAEFADLMAKPQNRQKVYNALSSKGYKGIGKDQAAFDSLIYQAQQPQQTYIPSEDTMGAGIGAFGSMTKKQQPEPKQVQTPAAQTKPTEPKQVVPTPKKQPQGSYTPSWQEQMAMGMTMGGAQNAVENAQRGGEQMVQNTQRVSPFGDTPTRIGQNNRVRKGKQSYNAETGQFEDTYLTSNGQSFKDVNQASAAQDKLDVMGQYEAAKANLEEMGLSDLYDNSDKDIEQQIKEAYAEKQNILKTLENDKEGERARRDVIMSGGYDPTYNAKLEERDAYNSALRMIDRRIKALEAKRDNAGFWQGTADVLTDSSNYSFGLTDLADAHQMEKISQKIQDAKEKGYYPRLTNAEKALAKNFLLNQDQQQLNKDNWWYESAGKGFGHTLSFMKDFALTGGGFMGAAKGGMALGGKAGTKLATKALGDYMTKNLGTKVLGKTMEYLGKGVGLAAGAEAGGFALNNTAQIASNFADITNKSIGNLTIDKNGQLDFKDSMSLGKAALISQLQRTGENGSELVGLAFDKMPEILGRVIQKTAVGKMLGQLTNNKYWKAWENGLGFLGVQSVWGEGMEEEYNMARTEILNRLSNNQFAPDGSGLFDLETQLDTWKTVGLTSAILRVPSMIASGVDQAEYYGNKYNLNTSDKELRNVFNLGEWGAERYDAVKSALDGANNQEIAGVLSNLLTNSGLTREEKEATVKYANDLIKLRGFNIGNVVAAANGYKPQPKVEGYNIKGLHVDAVDGEGNVIESYDYETPEDLKTGLYEMQQKRFDDSLKSDIAAMQARPDQQYFALVSNFLMDNGYGQESETPVSDFEAVLAKPSLERTDAEQQMVQQFAKVLHDTVYDNTMLHEEQSAEDGANAAETASIDPNNPDTPEVREAAVSWFEASQERDNLFANNEELKQEVESMEQQGLSHQEIISALETFAPNEVNAVINYYNQKARFESMMNKVNEKIDEEAANSRLRHTFKGTMNGQADTSNIYTITDGTNEYYLVSGNIIVSPDGQITDSTSGLIIGMDLDGSFVQLSDTSGYSVMLSQMSADDFEAAERERLQQLWTTAIDPNGTMIQGVTVGGEAGVANNTGANEPPTTSPEVAPQSTAADRIPKDEGGNMLYEQGAPEDTYDVLTEQTGSEQGAVVVATAQLKAATTELGKLQKKLEKGELQGKTIQEQIAETQALQQAISTAQAKAAYWQSVLDVANARKSQNNLNVQPEQNNEPEKPVSSQTDSTPNNGAPTAEELKQQRIAEAKAKYGELFDDDFSKANDVYELVSMWVGRKRNLAWEDVNGKRGLQKELGWTRRIGGDTKYIETLLAKNGEGMGVDEFVHMVWESPENSVGEEKRWDTEDIKEALLDLLRSAQSKSDVVDYALNSRIAQAEAALKALQEREEEEAAQTAENPVVEESPVNETESGNGVLPFPPTSEGTPAVEKPATETPTVEQPVVEKPTVAETQPEAPSVETPATAEETPDAEMEERKKFIAEHPLTEEQIDASDANQMRKILAKQYLNLDNLYVSELAKAAYLSIYNKVKAQQPTATTEAPQAEKPKIETKPTTEKPAPKQSAATQAAQAKVNAILARMKQHKKPTNNDVDAYSVEKLTPEQLDDMLDLVEAGAELGYSLLDSVETKDDWMNQMRDMIGEQLKDATGYTDTEVNDLLEDLWNSPYSVDGTEKTVAEWAAEKGINVNEIENGTEETGNGNGNTSSGVAVGSTVGGSTETGVGEQGPNDGGNTGTHREEGGNENVPRGNNGTGVRSGETGEEQPTGELPRGQKEGGNTTGQTTRPNINEPGGSVKETGGNTTGRGANSGTNRGNGTNVVRGTESGGTTNGQPSGGTSLGQPVGVKTDGEPGAPIMGQPETVNARRAIEDITKEKVPYKPNSAPEKYAIGSVIPSGIADAIFNAFKRLKEKFFPKKESTLDFVRKELGYKSNEEMLSDFDSGKTDGLAAEQIDAVALAIGKMKEGKSFIVGDMTGVGKGRTAAALIRWGKQQKKKVLFITEKSGLFSDMFRDLTDIGSDYLPFVTNSDTDANITDADGNKVVPKPSPAAQTALWNSEKDKLPTNRKGRQYDFVMTTYSQASNPRGVNGKKKLEWLKEYAKDAIVIMDESHNASGESNRGEYFQEIVKAAGGVTFLSATYAKRPDNMLLYAIRSSMNELHMSVGDMLQGIKDYGVAMQELMASALFGSGEMIRRERDMTDVKTTWTDPKEIFGEEEFEEYRKTSDKTMNLINDIIDFQRDVINPIVKAHEDEYKEANTKAALFGAPQTHATNTSYKSQVSNVVNLMTYAMKAKKAAEMAIEQIKQGKKPVIAVENTLDSYISELPDEMESANFGPIFNKGIRFSLKYMIANYALDKTTGKYKKIEGSEKYFDAENELDEDGVRALNNLRQRVQDYLGDTDKIDLTLSPIDLVKQMIADAGYSCGEITGRKTQLVKQPNGGYKKESIKQDKKGSARKFNGGSKKNPLPEKEQYQALILNVAGATGISLHSSKTFGNQQPRTMIILQPARDVNTEVQMRGRIDRTGQVHRGEYFYVTSPIPAEQKITMMLKQKLASLDAQSSATKKVSSNKVEGQDMDNKYGDDVCYNYLLEHLQDVNAFLDNGLTMNKSTREWEGHPGLLYDVLKDLQRMPCDMQEQVITELNQRYAEHIDYLNQNGINDLETTTMNLEATTIDKATFVKGKDNDSENEFAHDTTIERVEVNVLKKPMRSSDIKKKMKDLDALDEDGLPKEGVLKKTTDKAKEVVEQKLAERQAKFDEQEAKLEEKLRKDHPKKEDQTDEEYENMITTWPSLVEMKMKHKVDYGQYATDLQNQYNNVYRAAMYLKPGRPYLVPLTDDISSDGAMMYGRFLGFQMKNGDPRMIQAVFATKDSRVMISIPVHNKIKVIDKILNNRNDMIIVELERTKYGNDLSMEEKAKNWDEWWDKMIPKNTNRQIRYMITGNVLQACGTLGKYKGQIVTFTRKNKETGEITLERGMLLAENFDPENFQIRRQVKKSDIWDNYDEVKDDKSNISCHREGNHLVVKFDKRKGEKLSDHPAQKDDVLKGLLMNGELRPSKKDIVGVVKEENVEKVLEHLFKEYGYTKEELFVMPDSTEKPDAIVRTNRPYKEVIEQYKEKYGYSRYDVERKIKEMLKRYKMDVNNDNLKEEIREAVQLRQAYYRRDYANRESNRLAWEVLIHDQNIERFKDEKEYREREMIIKEAILEELESRGFKGNAYHYEQGKITADDVKKMFDTMNDTSTEEGKAKKALFDKVMAKVEKLPMEIFLNEKMDNTIGGEAGGRVVNYNWKYMNADYIADQAKADTILHELIHTVTAYADRCVEDGLEHLLDQDMIDAINELHSIYDAIRNDDTFIHDGQRAYGLTNVREMLSEAASNSEFRADLKKTGLWARLKAGFLAFFGIKPNQEQPSGSKRVNAYEQIMERLDYLIENFKQEAWEEYYKGSQFGGYGYKKQDAQKIDTDNPMEAINQVAESWRQTNQKPASNSKQQEITYIVNSITSRDDLKGSAPTYVINSRQDLEALNGQFNSRVYREIEKLYADAGAGAAYIPRAGIVVVFGEHLEDAKEAEIAWWHEQTHSFWQKTPEDVRRKYGETCFEWLRKNRPDIYSHITKPGNYPIYDWLNEACAYFMGDVVMSKIGTEAFINAKITGSNTEIIKFATELRNFIKYGRQEKSNNGSNQLRRFGEGEQESAAQIHGNNQQGQERRDNVIRPETESELQEVNDPLKAIENEAKRYRSSQTNNPAVNSAKALYDERLNKVETVFTEAYQDSMVSLKTAQNAIAKDQDIPDSQNAYMAENLMHGKNKNEQDLYNAMFRDPLINTINKIMNLTGLNWGDIDRYVYIKSGLERNREFFVRDWFELERMKSAGNKSELDALNDLELNWLDHKEGEYERLKNGEITYPEYLESLDKFIRANMDNGYEPSEHDYSGFRAMYGEDYDEADIINELVDTENLIEPDNVNTLWEQINAATRYGLERYRQAGMRSDAQIDRIESMFHFYVPMRGFKAETGEDMYQYFTGKGRAKSYVGGLLKHAKGRGSEAEYPISTIFAMSYKAIADCNQNLVNQKLYRLCQAHPNDLIVLSDSWAKHNPATDEWEEVMPPITDDMDEEEVRQTTIDFEKQMNDLASKGEAKKIRGKAQFDYVPMDKKNKSEHIVEVRINGDKKLMIVTGNPRMAQALNGQLRFERGHNVFSKWNAAIKNYMASVFTSYSPTFALRNMFRDWTHFRTMLSVREGEGYAKQASKYYRQSLFKMVGLFKKYREGTLDMNNEMEADFKDFMDNGGITGFVQMMKVDEIQQQMEKLNKMQKEGKPIQLNNKLWDYTLGAIEAINEGIENNARFATFRASRHYAGRSKARSAYDAKEITVNFNRKGAGGKTAGFKSQSKMVEDTAKAFGVTSQILGEGRIFFNATVQAIATTFKNFQNPDGSLNRPYIAKWAAKYALPPFMLGLALPYINKMLAMALGGGDDGDDDPYANLAEWTRRRNICIYVGKGNFLTMPIGQELAAFLALGDMFAGMTYAPDLKPVDRSFDEEMLGILNTFSPVDVDTKVTKGGLKEDPLSEVVGRSFSVLAPIVAVEQNLGWTGRPIYREDTYPSDKYNPEYQMVYNGTNPVLVGASKLANDLSGGDEVARGKIQVNPAIVQYLWEQYTGGPGKVFSNTISIGKDAKDLLTGNDNEFNMRKVEGLKAFVQQGDDRTAYYRTLAKYRKYKADADELSDKFSGYKKSAEDNPEALLKLEKLVKSEDFVRMRIVNEADKSLSKINKAANQAEGKQRKELRQLYNRQVKMVVDLLDQVGQE